MSLLGKRHCISCLLFKTPACRYASKRDLIDERTVVCEDFIDKELRKRDDEAKEVPVPRATVATPTFLAEECWPSRSGDPEYVVYNFQTQNFSTEHQIDSGMVDKRGRPKIFVPIDTMSLREGLVTVPRKPKACTFPELFEAADSFMFKGYDPVGQIAQVRLLNRVSIGSSWLDRYELNPEMKVAGMGMFAPIIPIRGPSGSGKNRLANILRLLSRRPYFEMSTIRIPSLFRPLHDWGPCATLYLDEADMGKTTEQSEYIHYLNCRATGSPVSRQDPNNPKITHAFNNFGLTILTQRRQFDDNATESRSLPFYSEITEEKLPTVETDDMIRDGLELQDMILFLRMTTFNDFKIFKDAWIENVSDPRLNASLLPLHALSLREPSLKDIISQTVREIETVKIQHKAASEDGAMVNYLYQLIDEGLAAAWNSPVWYFLQKREFVEIEGKEVDANTPLTTKVIADEMKWSAQHVRKVIGGLNLASKELPSFIKVGGKSYRAVFFEPQRLEKRLREFVVGYRKGGLLEALKVTGVTQVTLLTHGETEESIKPTVYYDRDLRDLRDQQATSLADATPPTLSGPTPVADEVLYLQEIHDAVMDWLRENRGDDGEISESDFDAFVRSLGQKPDLVKGRLSAAGYLFDDGNGKLRYGGR